MQDSPRPVFGYAKPPADPEPFREGAQRAREELTWAASARAHLDLYRELV